MKPVVKPLGMMLVSESLRKIVIQHTKALIADHQSSCPYFHQLCHCKNLKALVILDKTVTDASIAAIATQCPSLTSLDVYGCINLTDASIGAIGTQCPSLTSLDVYGCINLTDASIGAIGT